MKKAHVAAPQWLFHVLHQLVVECDEMYPLYQSSLQDPFVPAPTALWAPSSGQRCTPLMLGSLALHGE